MARRRNAAIPLTLPTTTSNDENEEQTQNGTTKISGGLLAPSFYQTTTQQQSSVCSLTTERYKLVVIGDEECGKTALLNTLVKSPDYEVEDTFTTFEECVTDIRTTQEHVEFTLYEITGMDDYSSLRLELYRGADIFLVCFDIGRPETLKNVVNKWAPEIADEYPKVPFLLVGCKNDLRTDAALLTNTYNENSVTAESVSRTKAETVAHKIRSAGYVECCAKTRWNIDRVFRAAAEAIIAKDELRDTAANQNPVSKQNSVLRRFSRLAASTTEKNPANLKRGSIFSFVVGSNN